MKQNNALEIKPSYLFSKGKQIFLLLLVLFCIHSNKASSQANSFGLTSSELNSVMQKVIDLPELQQYYPKNMDGSLKQLNILNYPLKFPSDLVLAKEGKTVNFLSETADLNKIEAYSRYRTIENNGSFLKFNFNYFYKDASAATKTLFVLIEFQKSGSDWNIVNSNIKGDTL